VQEFGVSRTPVREALIRLDSEGLVVLLPNMRARVAPLDLANTRELLEATEICLRVTTRWAAFRRTDRDLAEMNRHAQAFAEAAKKLDFTGVGEANLAFHSAIAVAAGNSHFTKLLTSLLSSALRLAQLATGQLPPGYQTHADYLASVVDEHARMVELIAKRDCDGAEELARKHAADFRERVMLYVSANLASGVRLGDAAD
jgi:DNA-binding GntR family transcriptional regulator